MTIVDVIEDVCEDGKQNLHGRLVLMLMRAGILVGEVVVLVVGVMVVVAVCVIFFWKAVFVTDRCEVLRDGFGLVGGDIFDLGGGFVALGVETGGWFGVGERGCC